MRRKLELKSKRRNSGRIPFGFDSDGGKLVVNKSEADKVKMIFSMYLDQKLAVGKIADEFNKLGIKNKQGNKWTRNAISDILKREEYREIVVDPYIYNEVQKVLMSKKNMPNVTYPLSSLLFCGKCGNTMFCRKRRYKNTIYRHYVCKTKHFEGEDKCNQENIDGQEIEELVLSDLKELMAPFRDKFKEVITIEGVETKEVEKNIDEIFHLDIKDLDETRFFFEFFIKRITANGRDFEIEYKFSV